MSQHLIRPMRPEDLETAERLSADAFYEVDVQQQRSADPAPERRPVARADNWLLRTRSLLETDRAGCWVAESGGEMVGFATSLRRETLWCLATFAVRPGLQGRGTGRALLDAAMQHSRGCLRGMLAASSDPRAVRLYQLAGFEMHPQMVMSGAVDRAEIPPLNGVRQATADDLEMMDSADRRARGAGRGADHALLAATGRPLVVDARSGSGYVYVDDRGSVAALAATDRRTATRLLWAALAEAPGEVRVPHVTGANQWALAVGTAARLSLSTEGYLGLRGMKPPTPYVHNGALL